MIMSLKYSRYKHKHQQGFTLVEIMVAVAISLFLLAGILQVMSTNKQTSRYQEAVARIQENARFALMFLGRDFRQAGYMGCTGNNYTNQLDLDSTNKSNFFNLLNPVAGWESASSAPGNSFTTTNTAVGGGGVNLSDWNDQTSADLPSEFNTLALEGTDVVIVKYVQESNTGATAVGNTGVTSAAINTTISSGIPENTIVLVTDCINADLFRNTNNETGTSLTRGVIASQDPANLGLGVSDWSHVYTGTMTIMQLVSNVYFVAQGSYGGPSLWRANFNSGPMSAPQELVEGVENMQVLYGEDTNGDSLPDQYVTMNAVTSVANIVSVRVSLLMRSIEEVKIIAAATAKTINAVAVTSQSDRNLRYIVTSTFKLRNRGVL